MKARPKHVQEIVKKANEYLRREKVKSQYNDLFDFVCGYLLEKDMYQGFNFYVDRYIKEVGETRPVLSGSATNYEYLQIW